MSGGVLTELIADTQHELASSANHREAITQHAGSRSRSAAGERHVRRCDEIMFVAQIAADRCEFPAVVGVAYPDTCVEQRVLGLATLRRRAGVGQEAAAVGGRAGQPEFQAAADRCFIVEPTRQVPLGRTDQLGPAQILGRIPIDDIASLSRGLSVVARSAGEAGVLAMVIGGGAIEAQALKRRLVSEIKFEPLDADGAGVADGCRRVGEIGDLKITYLVRVCGRIDPQGIAEGEELRARFESLDRLRIVADVESRREGDRRRIEPA